MGWFANNTIKERGLDNTYLSCPECQSNELIKLGFKYIKRTKTQKYQCKKCRRITIHPIVKEMPKRNDKGQFIRR